MRLLQQRGWHLARVNGSHHIFTKPGHRERIVVPVHGNHPLKLGLLKVSIDDAAKADSLFTLLMGDEVPPRRQFIEDNALNVQFLDV